MNKLLELVRKNGRETSENLAKMVGISEEEVVGQLEALEADGIIRAYQAVVNEEKLNHSWLQRLLRR